jgi:hypothetical protein
MPAAGRTLRRVLAIVDRRLAEFTDAVEAEILSGSEEAVAGLMG